MREVDRGEGDWAGASEKIKGKARQLEWSLAATDICAVARKNQRFITVEMDFSRLRLGKRLRRDAARGIAPPGFSEILSALSLDNVAS